MAIAEISIVPIGTGTTSVSDYVAEAVGVLVASGLSYKLTPMGTIIEGEIGPVMETARRMLETPFEKGAKRVYTVIKIDDRRDTDHGMDYKVHSVENKL